MMNKLKAKLKKQGGFTLVEMLIVVALIAILIAISIPAISQSLEKAKVATDTANERSAMALAIIKLTTADATELADLKGTNKTWYYDVNETQGELTATKPTGVGYGQSKGYIGGIIKITYTITSDKNTIGLTWDVDGSNTMAILYMSDLEV